MNATNQQYLESDLHLTEPHFDQEATLLSARPVVPLSDVKPEAPSRKRLGLGLAIAAAVMVGAFGASLIYKQSGQEQPAAVDTNTPAAESARSDSELMSGAGGVIPDTPSTPVAERPVVSGVPTASTNRVASGPRRSAPAAAARPAREREPEQVSDIDDSEERRAERREARRLRREAERQNRRGPRGRRNRPVDDLSRIREIFEGSRRP